MNPKYNLIVLIGSEVALRCENTLQNNRTIRKIFNGIKYKTLIID